VITHHVRPDGLPPVNGYSHVTVASGLIVHISGQVPVRPDGTPVDGGAEAQTEQVFWNLQTALEAVGASWARVVKLNYYLRDIGDLDEVRTVRDRFLDPAHLPASSLVQVAGLVHPGFRIEIDAVAALDD
jgi:enamine deaminase RidA (YjgF/YER057c/UK114 family)